MWSTFSSILLFPHPQILNEKSVSKQRPSLMNGDSDRRLGTSVFVQQPRLIRVIHPQPMGIQKDISTPSVLALKIFSFAGMSEWLNNPTPCGRSMLWLFPSNWYCYLLSLAPQKSLFLNCILSGGGGQAEEKWLPRTFTLLRILIRIPTSWWMTAAMQGACWNISKGFRIKPEKNKWFCPNQRLLCWSAAANKPLNDLLINRFYVYLMP